MALGTGIGRWGNTDSQIPAGTPVFAIYEPTPAMQPVRPATSGGPAASSCSECAMCRMPPSPAHETQPSMLGIDPELGYTPSYQYVHDSPRMPQFGIGGSNA